LETDQKIKTTSRCKLWSAYGNGSTAWYMDGWGGFQEDLYQGEEQKGRHTPAFLRYMGSRLHAETGCKKVHVAEVSEWQKKSMAAKDTIVDGGSEENLFSECLASNSFQLINSLID